MAAKPGDYYGFSAKDFGSDPEPNVRGPVGGKVGALLLALCRRIDGFPRHMGIHLGGMVITRDPLVRVAPVDGRRCGTARSSSGIRSISGTGF